MLILRKLLRDVPAMLGLVIVLGAVLLAFFPELVVPDIATANRGNILLRLQPPGDQFLFGTDDLGRDIFKRVVLGTRSALTIALAVVALAMFVGVPSA